MFVESERTLEVLETELADVQLGEVGVVRWIGGGVPCLDLVRTKLDQLQLVVDRWLSQPLLLWSF